MNASYNTQGLALEAELAWLSHVIGYRLSAYFGQPVAVADLYDITPPPLIEGAALHHFIREQQLSFSERLILILAFAPYLRPQLLDVLFLQNADTNRVFTEFGGVKSATSGFIPTIETALFLLAGTDMPARIEGLEFFYEDRVLLQSGLLQAGHQEPGEQFNNRSIAIAPVFQRLFTSGQRQAANVFDPSFPARRIETLLDISELVLPPATLRQLDEIVQWINHKDELLHTWNMRKFVKPGYVALFHGPPGTGKTLSASIIGKQCGMDVYRIDLSMVMSKYIGETEKNLAAIFDRAERKRWILFFDEADALFGKRTKVEDAHDRYANQEVSYLLQRIEEFPGVVILASNLKANIDDAFLRRIQSVIYFPVPGAAERHELWSKVFTTYNRLHADVDMESIAERYTVSGGTIVNVARYAALMAISRKEHHEVTTDMIEEGIRRELNKEGKSMS